LKAFLEILWVFCRKFESLDIALVMVFEGLKSYDHSVEDFLELG
jgi:hypothetical protein